MKKCRILSAFLVMLLAASAVVPTAAYAVEQTPSGEAYAVYNFGTSSASDSSRNMTFTSGGEYSDYGFKLIPYTTSVNSVTGPTTTAKSTSGSNISFDVTTAPAGYNDYYVEVEYLNLPKGFFYIKYSDKTGKSISTELVCPAAEVDRSKTVSEQCNDASKINETNAGVKKHIFRLENVDFTKNGDFSIETIRDAKSTSFEYGSAYTYIKKVTVYREEKYPVKAELTSEKVGNIFYDRDMIEFDVTFDGNTGADDFDAEVKIYSRTSGNEWEALSELDTEFLAGKSIAKGEKLREKLTFNVEKYGIYKIEVDVTTDDRTYTAATTEFSKSVGNTSLNKSLGVNMHSSTWDAGTMRNYAELTKNAGLGITRDGFAWHNYERKNVKLGLTNLNKAYLSICEDMGLEPYAVIHLSNPYNMKDSNNNGIPDKASFDGLAAYIEQLLNEPEFANVNNFEISNEPVLQVFWDEDEEKLKYGGSTASEVEEVYTKKGKAYGAAAEIAIKKIREVRGDSAKIAVLSLCDTDTKYDQSGNRTFYSGSGKSKYFAMGALEYLSDPNGDDDKSDSVLNDVDVISYHPYAYRAEPEVIRERSVNGIEELAADYGFNGTSAWHTEFGISTCTNPTNVACIGDEYKQALSIVRSYASMYTQNNNDKFIIYDLIDDDIVLNAQESNYGILHSEAYSTPYAAKFAYLAVSNLNKMIEDTPKAEFVYDSVSDLLTGDYTTETNGYGTKGEYVACFSGDGTDRKVYMLWSIEKEKEIDFEISEDVIAYYDYLGNEIAPEAVETANGYKLTNEPFYAVCGKDIERSVAERGGKASVTVEGVASSEAEGENVTLIVSERSLKSIKAISEDDILYVDFCDTENEGKYYFKFDVVSDADTVYAYILEADGTESKTAIKPRKNNAELFLYKNMQAVDEDSVSASTLNNIYVAANMRGDILKYPDAILIMAFYNNGQLQYTTTHNMKNSIAFKAVEVENGTTFDELKVLLWDGVDSLKPVCDNIYVK